MSYELEEFKFRTGKFANKSYGWVCDNHPWYIEWVIENRPEMLREHKKPKKKKPEPKTSPKLSDEYIKEMNWARGKDIKPNKDFFINQNKDE